MRPTTLTIKHLARRTTPLAHDGPLEAVSFRGATFGSLGRTNFLRSPTATRSFRRCAPSERIAALAQVSQHAGYTAQHRALPFPESCSTFHLPSRSYSATSAGSSNTSKACPECGRSNPLPSLVCTEQSCGAIQVPAGDAEGVTPYELLGLQLDGVEGNGWRVDLDDLKARWRKAIAMTHPDRARQRGEKQEQLALAQSSVLNKAYLTLLNPLARATWLLEHGSHAAPGEEEGVEDPALLMQVMEFREALEEASNEEQAEQVGSDNQIQLQSTLQALDEAFTRAQPEYEKIKSLIIQLRYWMNIDKAAREWSPGQRVELKH